MNGKIKKVVLDKGFGFIRGEDGNEYFVHRTAFTGNATLEGVTEGDAVTFDVGRGDKGPRAENVRLQG